MLARVQGAQRIQRIRRGGNDYTCMRFKKNMFIVAACVKFTTAAFTAELLCRDFL